MAMVLTIRRVAAPRSAVARAAALLSIVAAFAAAAAEDDGPSVVPYRPSVSTPAALSAPGWLEVESGFTHEHAGAGVRRDSVPVTLKLAFTPDWGVRIGADAWVQRRDESGERATGSGDTAIIVKRRFAVDDESAFGSKAGERCRARGTAWAAAAASPTGC